jgi:hypothetical protein
MTTKARRRREKQDYGWRHQQIRRSLIASVAAGVQPCARCGEPIEPGEPWDLGHDDRDRRFYSGPEHERCNRSAPMRNVTSREW